MATLRQVAERAGCSTATASRVLNHSGPVSPAMVGKVRKAAGELGYRAPGATAKGGRRPVIGVLVPSLTNPVFAASLSGIQNRMLSAGHSVLIAQSNYDPLQEADAVSGLMSERPTGLILTVCNGLTSQALLGDLPPTVLLHNLPTERHPAAVTVDNFAAGRDLTRYLLQMGHERILFVSGSFAASDRAARRYQGYLEALREVGKPPLDAMQISFVSEYDQIDILTAIRDGRPTAIIGSNDLLALGVIAALRREGLAVPRDMSVAGFDGIVIGRLIDPPLTTMNMPDASMGTTAASLLLDMVENAAPDRHLELAYSLHKGGTVRDLNQSSK
ncbi:substrate-binding domain-containing protein [Rhizobium sp.]|uniref:substrate-binding domain-containing protein n=1 Tax=Rhizobium sp. TaxID=391 RepID=UPI000DD7272B